MQILVYAVFFYENSVQKVNMVNLVLLKYREIDFNSWKSLAGADFAVKDSHFFKLQKNIK